MTDVTLSITIASTDGTSITVPVFLREDFYNTEPVALRASIMSATPGAIHAFFVTQYERSKHILTGAFDDPAEDIRELDAWWKPALERKGTTHAR